MAERYEAVVVGGGIVGSSAAYHLVQSGIETLLIDRHDEGRATDAGAGILSPATSTPENDDVWLDFAIEAVVYYDELVTALETEQDGSHGYAERELMRVATDEDEATRFDDTLESIRERQDAGKPPARGSLHELSSTEAREAFPPLVETRRALYYDNAARVDGQQFEGALRRAGKNHGLTILDATVERVIVDDGSITGVVTDDERIPTNVAVVAGGAWSAEFGDQLGIEVPIEPQRGQIVHLTVEADTADWPIISPFHDHYLVPWDDGRVAIGATRENAVGFTPHTTVAGLEEVLSEAIRVAPGLADASLQEAQVGLRPLSPDGLPVLGTVSDVEGAFVATGHGPTGLQLGPYSGKLVADMIRGIEPAYDLTPFAVDRF
jgi:D-amino-acid dehydrogenase